MSQAPVQAVQAVQRASLDIAGTALNFDAASPQSLALVLDFDGAGPHWFDGPAPSSVALRSGAFSGRVSQGASCNASTLKLTPHCDGTHTECVGHLTRERCDVRAVAPVGLLPALLLSVVTTPAAVASAETSVPAPRPGDLFITRQALTQAWPTHLPLVPQALIVRTLPNSLNKLTRDYRTHPAPFLSREAAELLVERGIEHLVLDLPSADRADDDGQLCAHRVFFGLAPGETALAAVQRAQCTITELAFIPDTVSDGPCLLQLQIPALAGDALPSRPLHFRLLRS